MADPTSTNLNDLPDPPKPVRGDEVTWGQAWHVPVLLLGLGMLVLGTWMALPTHEAPDYAGQLRTIAQYLKADNLEQADEEIQRVVTEFAGATLEQQGHLQQLRGDYNFQRLHSKYVGIPMDTEVTRDTNQKIAAFYADAEEGGHLLGPTTMRRFAETLVMLGREREALALVDRLPTDSPAERYGIIRTLIERHPGPVHGDVAELTHLIQRFQEEVRAEPDRSARRAADIWITGHEAHMDLITGNPGRAIDRLLRNLKELQRYNESNDDLAPLMVQLAKAYQRSGDIEMAFANFMRAQQMVTPSHELNAEVLVGLGQIALSRGSDNDDAALEYFGGVTERFPSSPVYIDALLGRADVEARKEEYGFAVEHFRLAIDLLMAKTSAWDPRREMAKEMVKSHIAFLVEKSDYPRSLDFLALLKPMYEPVLPPDLLEAFAIAHERIGEYELARAEEDEARIEKGLPPLEADARRLANQRAAAAFAKSAGYYEQYAKAVTITRDHEHGDALWAAARNFDRAQRWDRSVKVYAEFVKTRGNDSRQLLARSRLGKAYLSAGQSRAALDQFRSLYQEHPKHVATFESLVPMAQAYADLGDVDAARRTLLAIVSDHPSIGPDSEHYRDALIALAKFYYRQGEQDPEMYVAAIERLAEAVDRYGDTRHGSVLRFQLADSYRKSVQPLDTMLEGRRSQKDRVALQAERNRRLQQAQMYYNQVIHDLESRAAGMLLSLEKLYLRNAYFYQADCAFDRGRYEEAIQLYSSAADRWDGTPASLVALVQTVNAYCELGEYRKAQAANKKAHWQLDRIPEAAFNDPDAPLPMTREHWEDWLRWTNELNIYGSQANSR